MTLKDYLQIHTIVQIGVPSSEYAYSEVIVDNYKDLISVVIDTEFYISKISWWHRTEIITGSSIGYGGPRDPRNPEVYYFAETDICQEFKEKSSLKDIYNYFDKINREYSNFELYPSFDIKAIKK